MTKFSISFVSQNIEIAFESKDVLNLWNTFSFANIDFFFALDVNEDDIRGWGYDEFALVLVENSKFWLSFQLILKFI
jgi:hypothetical protein